MSTLGPRTALKSRKISGSLAYILAQTNVKQGTKALPNDVAGCTLEMGADGLWTGASVGTLTQVQADALVASGAMASVKVGTPGNVAGTLVCYGGVGAGWVRASDIGPGSPSSPFATVNERTAWATANLSSLLPGRTHVWGPGSVEYVWNGPGPEDWNGIEFTPYTHSVNTNNSTIPVDLTFSVTKTQNNIVSPQNIISSAGKVTVGISNISVSGNADTEALKGGHIKLVGATGSATAKTATINTSKIPFMQNFACTIDVLSHITAGATLASTSALYLYDVVTPANFVNVQFNGLTGNIVISGGGAFALADVIIPVTVGTAYKLGIAIVNDAVMAFLDSGDGWKYVGSYKSFVQGTFTNVALNIKTLYYQNGGSLTIGSVEYGRTGECGLADPTIVRYADGSLFRDESGYMYATYTSRFWSGESTWANQVKYSHSVLARISRDGDVVVVSHLFFKRGNGYIFGDSPATITVNRANGKWSVIVPGFNTSVRPLAFIGDFIKTPINRSETVVSVSQLVLPNDSMGGAWDYALLETGGYTYLAYATYDVSGKTQIVVLRGADISSLTSFATWTPAELHEGIKVVRIGSDWFWAIGGGPLAFDILPLDLSHVITTVTYASQFGSNAAITHPAIYGVRDSDGYYFRMLTFGGPSFSGCDQVGYGCPLVLESQKIIGQQTIDA